MKHVFNRRANRVGIDHHVVIDQVLRQTEGFFTDLFDCCAIGKNPDFFERHAFACADGLQHRIRIDTLYADDFDVWVDAFDVRCHTGDRATAADGDKYRVYGTFCAGIDTVELAHNFHANRALSRNHIGVIVWVNESEFALFFQLQCFVQCVGIRAAVQYNFDMLTTKAFDGFNLNRRGGFRYNDGRVAFEFGRRICDTLRVIACRCGNHTFFELLCGELRHFVVRPTNFV